MTALARIRAIWRPYCMEKSCRGCGPGVQPRNPDSSGLRFKVEAAAMGCLASVLYL